MLTPAELKERKDKGLCFKCNKKYGLGHRCKRLFMIEACQGEDGNEDVLMSEDEDEGESIKGQFPFLFFSFFSLGTREMLVGGMIGSLLLRTYLDKSRYK
jgi:hypothetical protein